MLRGGDCNGDEGCVSFVSQTTHQVMSHMPVDDSFNIDECAACICCGIGMTTISFVMIVC